MEKDTWYKLDTSIRGVSLFIGSIFLATVIKTWKELLYGNHSIDTGIEAATRNITSANYSRAHELILKHQMSIFSAEILIGIFISSIVVVWAGVKMMKYGVPIFDRLKLVEPVFDEENE